MTGQGNTVRAAWLVLIAAVLLAPRVTVAGPPPLPENPQAAARLLELAGEGFCIREIDHFTIAYDTPYDVLRVLVDRLEGTYKVVWRFCEQQGFEVKPPAERLEVILIDRFEDYQRYCAAAGVDAATVAGFYSHATNVSVFGNVLNRPDFAPLTRRIDQLMKQVRELGKSRSNSAALRRRRSTLLQEAKRLKAARTTAVERYNRMIIQHEATHQMLFNMGVHLRGGCNPGWLVEGLACQFEMAQVSSPKGLRRINHTRLADFREAFDVPPEQARVLPTQHGVAERTGRFVPLAEMIGNARWFEQRGPQQAFRYAQAWSLVFYLHRAHREEFAAYVRQAAARRPGQVPDRAQEIREFESAFGPIDERLQSDWLTYIFALRFDRDAAGR